MTVTLDPGLKPGVDNYAVIGNPVAHSKSPQIHSLFAEQCGHSLCYQALLVEPGSFSEALKQFRDDGGRGCNITVPFKSDAWQACDFVSPRARKAQAVNVIRFDEIGSSHGDNTDGVGLVKDLQANGIRLDSKRVLLLGAGGAARGVLGPLLDSGVKELVIANRTLSRAEELAALFEDQGTIRASGFDALRAGQAEVVINATSTGLHGEVPTIQPAIVRGTKCYDMLYGDAVTPFLAWADFNGAERIVDGLGMLVYQAAESFLIWRGVYPDVNAVLAVLRSA